MKKQINVNEKIIFLILVILVLIIFTVFIVRIIEAKQTNFEEQYENEQITENIEGYTVKLNDESKVNVSKEFNSSKIFGELEINNVKYQEKEQLTEFSADVTNLGTEKHEAEMVKLIIIGSNGEQIAELTTMIGEIEPKQSISLYTNITGDVSNAKDYKIEKIK